MASNFFNGFSGYLQVASILYRSLLPIVDVSLVELLAKQTRKKSLVKIIDPLIFIASTKSQEFHNFNVTILMSILLAIVPQEGHHNIGATTTSSLAEFGFILRLAWLEFDLFEVFATKC